jgi:hypothetical protein
VHKYTKLLAGVWFSSLLMYPSLAHAGFSCPGQVAYLGSGNDGAVQVSVGNGVWTICNLTSIYNGSTTPQGCQGWYSMLISAKLAGRSVVIFFNSDAVGNDGITSCSNLGDWTQRTPYHIGLQ